MTATLAAPIAKESRSGLYYNKHAILDKTDILSQTLPNVNQHQGQNRPRSTNLSKQVQQQRKVHIDQNFMQIGELNQESVTTVNHGRDEKGPVDIRLSGTFTSTKTRPRTGNESKTMETVSSSAVGHPAGQPGSRGMN